MKTPITLGLLAILALAPIPASAAERACRPSLSNWYHCPDTSKPAPRTTERTPTSNRPCRPSLSNLWTCPGTSKARQRTTRPDISAERNRPAKPTRTTSVERGCRPSLSNGFKCPPKAERAKTNTAARGRPGRTARLTQWSGQTRGRTSITFAAPTIMAALSLGPTCVNRTQLLKGCEPRKMRRILEARSEISRGG
jgi:hypothetical protein